MSSTRETRHENTREKILQAALELIDRDGVHKFSLRAVARKVEYSPAGLYEYFDGKEGIVNALCQIADDKLAYYLSDVPSDLPYHEFMVEMGLGYICFAREESTYFRLSFVNRLSERETLDEPVQSGAYLILLNGVQRGIDEGYFVVSDEFGTEQIAYSLWSMVHGMASLQQSYLAEMQVDFESIDREALRRFILGMKYN